MKEIWYDIEDFPNYQISSKKRIRTLAHTITEVKVYKGRILAQQRYGGVIFMRDGKPIRQSVPKLAKAMFTEEELKSKNEIWRKVEGFEFYEISNHLRARSLTHKQTIKGRKIKPTIRKVTNGQVTLMKDGKIYCRGVEKLYRRNVLREEKDKQKKHRRKQKLKY